MIEAWRVRATSTAPFRVYSYVIPSAARNLPPSRSVRGLGGCTLILRNGKNP